MSDYTRLAGDLKIEALKFAGEVTDGSSPFDAITYEYLDLTQKILITGGHLGPSPEALPIVDWTWARARPRGAFRLSLPLNAAKTNALTLTKDSTAATAAISLGTSNVYQYWRLIIGDVAQRPWIASHVTTAVTLNVAWTDATTTTTDWIAVPEDYACSNALRVISPFYCDASPYRIDIVSVQQLEGTYPTALATAGVPVLAAEIAPSRFRFSHYWYDETKTTTAGPTLEYEYLQAAALLDTTSDEPAVPFNHRYILVLGAAFLIASQKRDTIAEMLWKQFVGAFHAMRMEEAAKGLRPTSQFGRVIPRPGPAQQEGITWVVE